MTIEHHCDVAIVGLGGAGAAAAITAHESGADVLVVEKQKMAGEVLATRVGRFGEYLMLIWSRSITRF